MPEEYHRKKNLMIKIKIFNEEFIYLGMNTNADKIKIQREHPGNYVGGPRTVSLFVLSEIELNSVQEADLEFNTQEIQEA